MENPESASTLLKATTNAPTRATATASGLVGCRSCGGVNPAGAKVCYRCRCPVHPVDTASLQRVWAWLIAGLIAYVPANLFPMLKTTILGHTSESTLIGGVIDLVAHGSFGVALIVFFASVVIPVGKFIAIIYLALSVKRHNALGHHQRLALYEVVEFIGRWSMIDVFVVAILSALVQLDFAAAISPGAAAVSFALSVAFTMLAAQSFDPRLIWNATESAPV